MKIGFDIHGVIDHNPEFFSILSNKLIKAGHDVYIITGLMKTDKVVNILKDFEIIYSHFFSVSDYLISIGKNVRFSDPDNPWFDSDVWIKCKGEFCDKEGIDIHFDDTFEYGKYFKKTVFVNVVKVNKQHRFEVVGDEKKFKKFADFYSEFIEERVIYACDMDN